MNNSNNIFNMFDPFQDFYEQQLINNIMDQTINQPNPNKKILSKKGEKQLEKVEYKSDDFSMKECPITMRAFQEGDTITKLPCNHVFDTSGIWMWLKEENASCPICRMELDFIEVKQETNTPVDISNSLFQTNPLTLFSNITIDLSLNPSLLQPYHRNYNIESFEPLTLGEEEEEDDIFFYNTMQLLEDSSNILSNFQHIIEDYDLSMNI